VVVVVVVPGACEVLELVLELEELEEVEVEVVGTNDVDVEVVGEKLVLEVEVDVVVGVTHGSHGLDLEQGSRQQSPLGSG
tara:strand:+ start:2222 stop:2461 length:240 start_codon:yes stop_codon:yes gene_type:complete